MAALLAAVAVRAGRPGAAACVLIVVADVVRALGVGLTGLAAAAVRRGRTAPRPRRRGDTSCSSGVGLAGQGLLLLGLVAAFKRLSTHQAQLENSLPVPSATT